MFPYITPHQKTNCAKCREGANLYNHCAFCGANYDSLEQLAGHLDNCPEYKKVFGG